jgi:hypothetical protein
MALTERRSLGSGHALTAGGGDCGGGSCGNWVRHITPPPHPPHHPTLAHTHASQQLQVHLERRRLFLRLGPVAAPGAGYEALVADGGHALRLLEAVACGVAEIFWAADMAADVAAAGVTA